MFTVAPWRQQGNFKSQTERIRLKCSLISEESVNIYAWRGDLWDLEKGETGKSFN